MFAVFYGLDWIATVPPTVRLTGEAFGRENTGVVYGWIGASHQLGASLAAFGAGAIRTVAGDYRLAFWIAGVLCVLAGVSFLTIGRRAFSVEAFCEPSDDCVRRLKGNPESASSVSQQIKRRIHRRTRGQEVSNFQVLQNSPLELSVGAKPARRSSRRSATRVSADPARPRRATDAGLRALGRRCGVEAETRLRVSSLEDQRSLGTVERR